VIFLPILAKTWLPWQRPLDTYNQNCLLWIGRRQKPPVISNHVLAISRRNAFICIYSNFSPRIGCRRNTPLSLVYGSVTDEFPDSTALSQIKLCMDMLHTTDVMAIFVICLPIYFGQNLVAMATSLRPLQSEIFFGLVYHENPVISNRILVISHTNAFICTYMYFCPKIGCHSNAPLSLVYGSVTDEFRDSANPVSKPNSARICCMQLKL